MPFRFGTRRSLGLPVGGGGAILKPQDVFATSLYTGNGSTQTITNGIDLAGKGGLVWGKKRSAAGSHFLIDNLRSLAWLSSDTTAAETKVADAPPGVISSFNSNGFTLGLDSGINASGASIAAWSIARAAKFFDIVTWTGDGTGPRSIPHGLGAVPGMIVVKSRSAAGDWPVYHQGLTSPTGQFLKLNTTDAAFSNSGPFGATAPTSTSFTVGNNPLTNTSGTTYVAYLFAHDPSADGVVQCGSFTGAPATINLGWQPQFFMHKRTDVADSWYIYDTVRGFSSGADKFLQPNTSDAEQSFDFGAATSTGVTVNSGGTAGTNIYLAIRAPT